MSWEVSREKTDEVRCFAPLPRTVYQYYSNVGDSIILMLEGYGLTYSDVFYESAAHEKPVLLNKFGVVFASLCSLYTRSEMGAQSYNCQYYQSL